MYRQARKRARDAEADGSVPQLGGPRIGDAGDYSDNDEDDERTDGHAASRDFDSGSADDDAVGSISSDDDEDDDENGMDGVDMLQSSDDDDDDDNIGPRRSGTKRGAPRPAPEPSHAGMALAGKRRMAQGSDKGAGELDGLSVQEQEALALRMLRNR